MALIKSAINSLHQNLLVSLLLFRLKENIIAMNRNPIHFLNTIIRSIISNIIIPVDINYFLKYISISSLETSPLSRKELMKILAFSNSPFCDIHCFR